VQFIKKFHDKVKAQIEKQTQKYVEHNNKGRKKIIFEEGEWIWLHLTKERFPNQRNLKLNSRGDGPFQVLQCINDNGYRLDLSTDYGVNTTFNVCDLIPFVSGGDYNEELDLRTDPLQEGWSDEGSSGRTHIGLLTRAMTKRLEEEEGAQKTLILWRIKF